MDQLEGLLDHVWLGVAHLGELANVLHGVSAETAARLLEGSHALSVALPVFWQLWRVLDVLIEMLGEELVEELAVLDLLLQHLVGLLGALTKDLLVGHVEVVVTRVDHLELLLLGLVGGQAEHARGFGHEHLKGRSRRLADALEVANWLVLPGEVAELLDGGHVSLALDGGSLLTESLNAKVVGIGVLHPVDGEEITEAAAHVLSTDEGVSAAVSSPR